MIQTCSMQCHLGRQDANYLMLLYRARSQLPCYAVMLVVAPPHQFR